MSVAGPSPTQRVGARIEVVPPRKLSEGSDWAIVLSLVVISIVVHSTMILRSTSGSKDSIAYARYGRALLHPTHELPAGESRTQLDIIRNNPHHPGFPLIAGICTEIVTQAWPAPLPRQMMLGVQGASALGAVLLILPAYWIGRLLFTKGVGFGVALLTQLLPVFAQNAADGLSDLTHLAFATASLLFGLRAFRRPRIGQFLLAGVFSGLAYLIRPEGLSAGLAIAIATAVFVLRRRIPKKLALAGLVAFVVGGLLAAMPYMLIINGLTNKPTGQSIVPFENPRLKMIRGEGAAVGGALFGRAIDNNATGLHRLGIVLLALVEETSKSTHHSVLVLGLLGLWLLRKRFREQPELVLLIVYMSIHVGLLILLGMKRSDTNGVGGYISERHTLPLSFGLLVFAVAGMAEFFTRLAKAGHVRRPKAAFAAVLLMIVASCAPQLAKWLHPQHQAHLNAAEFLKEHMNLQDDHLFDPYEWSAFYSGHSVYFVRPDWYRMAGRGRWLTWEVGDKEGPNKSARWKHTKQLLESHKLQPVFPEPGSPLHDQKGTVQVYYMPFTHDEIQIDEAERKRAEADAKDDSIPAEQKTRLKKRY